ncbi:hypothetical protein P3X46_006143 [Hevea brasiliensis]|uniref:Preprotein translocase subunit SECE1 n=1 Tax=Hevea brasiliensis TaxID=3981 RepID=A0ABQ9MPA2_HEVBR|nr:preprotein translocase subunit SECE1 [Hevea brasiliensis]KAJ9182116.1 hypothetical protein P3X46_006143 [Hevea brasiliensis]
MALAAFSLKLPLNPQLSRITQPNPSLKFKPPPACRSPLFFRFKFKTANAKGRSGVFLTRAVEESQESTESEATKEEQSSDEASGEVSDVGAEIKRAMKKGEKEGDLLSGVVEEIQEIEWPAFGKVLGTTGVVIGVIAGSSLVLLTVNAVLAELSDRVFAGRGVQDFFS